MSRYFDAIVETNTNGGMYVKGRKYSHEKNRSCKHVLPDVPQNKLCSNSNRKTACFYSKS